MKKKLLGLVIAILVCNLIYAQSQAVVLVLRNKNKCGLVTDLNFEVSKQENKAFFSDDIPAVKELTGGNPSSFVETTWAEPLNEHGTMYQNYVVVISGETVNEDGCHKITYGVGFATSRVAALIEAINSLQAKDNNWSEDKNGYKELLSKDLFAEPSFKYKQKAAVIGDRA